MATDEANIPGFKLCCRLIDAGVKLLVPPQSIEGILSALDSAEELFGSLRQDPPPIILDGLLPGIRGLYSDKLFKHPNMDVKVAVMSCIHEIVRTTAPDAPYEDESMKEILQETVENVFGNLPSLSGCSYAKAINILHNVAKVRSHKILLQLGCNALISRMFQIFLDTIQPEHPEAVSLSMEEIMSSLILESDELSLELLKPLLDEVNKENQIISPPSRRLAVKVLKNCTEKVRPYLIRLAETLRKDAEACTYVLASTLLDTPASDNVNEEAEKDLSDIVPILEGGAVGSEEGSETNASGIVLPDVNQNTSLTSLVTERVELLVDDESVPLDTLQTMEKMESEAFREGLVVGRQNGSKRLMEEEQIEQLLIDSICKRPAFDNVISDFVQTPEDGTAMQRNDYKSSLVNEHTTKAFNVQEQIVKLQVHGIESVQSDSVGSQKGSDTIGELLSGGGEKKSRTLSDDEQIEQRPIPPTGTVESESLVRGIRQVNNVPLKKRKYNF